MLYLMGAMHSDSTSLLMYNMPSLRPTQQVIFSIRMIWPTEWMMSYSEGQTCNPCPWAVQWGRVLETIFWVSILSQGFCKWAELPLRLSLSRATEWVMKLLPSSWFSSQVCVCRTARLWGGLWSDPQHNRDIQTPFGRRGEPLSILLLQLLPIHTGLQCECWEHLPVIWTLCCAPTL